MNPRAAAAPLLRRIYNHGELLPRALRSQPRLVGITGLYLAASVVAMLICYAAGGVAGALGCLLVLSLGLAALLFALTWEAFRQQAHHERRIAVLLANASEALAVTGPDGRVRLANPAAERLFGVTSEAVVGHSLMEFLSRLHPDDRAANSERMAQLLSTPGASQSAEVRLLTDDAEYRLIQVTSDNRTADPAVGGVVVSFHDVTDQRASENKIARLAAAVEQADEAVVISDPTGRIEYVNPAFERVTGYTAAEALGGNPRMLNSGRQPASFYHSMWSTLTAGQPWVADFINRRKDGTEYQSSAVISSIRDDDGVITGYVAVSRDVTAERRTEVRAAQLARERALIAETIRTIDTRKPVETIAATICGRIIGLPDVATSALVIFGLDGRAVPYGIVSADGEALPRRPLPARRVEEVRAQAMKGPWIEAWHDRPWHPYNEVLGRLGVRAVAYAPIRVGGGVIGYLLISSASEDAEGVLSAALPALVEFADLSAALVGPKIAEWTKVEEVRGRLTRVIEQGSFMAVFQPIVDITNGRVVGYEALTRFDGGASPEEQFAEAAAAGMGKQLELATATRALEDAEALPPGAWLNINASPALILGGNGFAQLVQNADRPMVIELTEHEQIRDYAEFRSAVRRLGPSVRLAVDDAGAGFASLRHILELQPSFVKLDRALITNLGSDQARQALVAGMKHFAKTAGFWIIAEGVETEDDLNALRVLDIHYAQGYLLGRPEPTTPQRPSKRRDGSGGGRVNAGAQKGDTDARKPVRLALT